MRGKPPVKDYVQAPVCPFCGENIERPREVVTTAGSPGMPVGSCPCGAVYAFDISGRNLGSAFIEALVFACNMDWDLAWELLPDRDYREKIVENYDPENHLLIPGGFFEGRKITGALYFIRLNRGLPGTGRVTGCGRAVTGTREKAGEKAACRKISKKELEAWVKDYRVEEVLQAASRDQKILWLLRRLFCAADILLRMRAADLAGKAAGIIAGENPAQVAEFLKALLNSLSDTGTSSWATLDAAGEIISCAPDKFAGYLPALIPFLREEHLKADVLRALWKVAAVKPELLQGFTGHLASLLDDDRPEVRGYAILILGALKETGVKKELEALLGDNAEITVYEDGQLSNRRVGQLAEEVLKNMNRI
ncbi:MAG: hypothetical protein PWP72_1453 [Thermoanaerobacter sp.]|jgi:hypothetical protein|nr:hypothetical protein [Thermoanaerobacter sp.]